MMHTLQVNDQLAVTITLSGGDYENTFMTKGFSTCIYSENEIMKLGFTLTRLQKYTKGKN